MSRTSDPVKCQQWRERLGRYRIAGQTVAEFCLAEDVSEASFYYWKRQLTLSSSDANNPSNAVSANEQPSEPASRKQREASSIEAGSSAAATFTDQHVKRKRPIGSRPIGSQPISSQRIGSASPATAAFQSVELLTASSALDEIRVATIRLPNGIELELQRDQLMGDGLLESLFSLPSQNQAHVSGASDLPC